MFYPKGSVLVGRFLNGAPDGPVHYVWPNGSFYKGNAVDHKANDKFAVYECEDFAYSGSILDNNF